MSLPVYRIITEENPEYVRYLTANPSHFLRWLLYWFRREITHVLYRRS